MPSIVERKNTAGKSTWSVRWRVNGRQRSIVAADYPAAKKLRALIYAHGDLPSDLEKDAEVATAPTFDEWTQHYLAHLTAVSDRTRDDYARQVARHMTDLHDLPLPAITRDIIRRWVLATAPTVAGKTLKNLKGTLNAILAEAVEAGHIDANPSRGVRLPRTDDHQRVESQFLTQDEFWAIAAELDDHWRPVFVLLAATGLRMGELMALTVGDVDLAATPPVIHVTKALRYTRGQGWQVGPTKTARSRRTVSLAPMVVDALRPLLGRPKAARLVAQPNGGTMYPSNLYARVWRPAVKAAQAKGMEKNPRIHDLRHSHASWLIAQGTPLPVIQNRLGHEQITTTIDRYGHLTPDVHVDAAAAVML